MVKTKRTPLSKERVLDGAVSLADEIGIDALTMRRLAESLDVEVMSLYYHLPNKDAVLGGMVDLVFGETATALEGVDPPEHWKAALRHRILTSRSVMLRHPWAPSLIESRTSMGLPLAMYVDAVIAILMSGGFTLDTIHHGMHALGSRVYGFIQEPAEPDGSQAQGSEALAAMASMVPNLVGMLMEVSHGDPSTTLGWCDDQFEFEFGLDLLLDGLERLL